MEHPVYVYYEMRNFYQNHINYVKSRDYPQLRGEDRTKADIKTCSPIKDNSDLYSWTSWKDVELKQGDVANPCGLCAYTVFNGNTNLDTYSVFYLKDGTGEGVSVKIDTDDIAWKNDVDVGYSRADNSESEQWLDVENGIR